MANDGADKASPILLDEVIGEAPLVVRRFVKWGDTDFARVVYTTRFLDYMMEAAEVWFKRLTGEPWAEFGVARGITVPAVGCSLDFHHALGPDEQLDITVFLERIGRSSHTVSVKGHDRNGVHCFDGIVTFATIDPAAEKSVPMPDDLVARLNAYKRACEGP